MENQSQGTFKVKRLLASDEADAGIVFGSPLEAAWHSDGMRDAVVKWVSDDLIGALAAIMRESPNQVIDDDYLRTSGSYCASRFKVATQAKRLAASVCSPFYASPDSPDSPMFGKRPMSGDGIAEVQCHIQRAVIPSLLSGLEERGFRVVSSSEPDSDIWILPPSDSY